MTLWKHNCTIIVLLLLHLHLFVLIFDKLKTGPHPTLFSGEPLLSSQLSRPREWPLNRGSTVCCQTSCKWPPKMSSLGACLLEVVAYESLDHIGSNIFYKDNKTLIPWLKLNSENNEKGTCWPCWTLYFDFYTLVLLNCWLFLRE